MARTYGRLLCTIWQNPDFIALTAEQKVTYVMLLTQPKLSLVGALDLKVARWQGFGIGDVEANLAGLEATRFVALDGDTHEVLVRSFTRNDPINMANAKLRKGLWGAFLAVESEHLQRVAVDNMPDAIWSFPDDVPVLAHMRRSERMEQVMDEVTEHPMEQVNGHATDSPPPLTTTSPFDHRPAPTGDASSVLGDIEASRRAVHPQGARTGSEG